MIEELFADIAKKNVLVIGDMMIDAYLSGSVSRISPEAPVPIVDVRERTYRLGGAANVAVNLLSMGANPLLCSVIGSDEKGRLLLDLMRKEGLDTQCVVQSDSRRTTLKYRIIGNKFQMLRIDEEDQHLLSMEENEMLLLKIRQAIENKSVDAIIFEDYDKGVLTKDNIRSVTDWALAHQIIVAVDPKKNNFNHYQGVTLFKPNLKELKEGVNCRKEMLDIEEIKQLMKDYAVQNQIRYVFTTLSERGVALYDGDQNVFYHYPAFLRKISDVSGAGDTVISVATLCMLINLPIHKVAQIANLAGGIVCESSGVVPIHLPQLFNEIMQNQILE